MPRLSRRVVRCEQLFKIVEGAIPFDEAEAVLSPRGLWQLFLSWFNGQTGPVLSDGRYGIYPSDMQRFLEGKPDAEWS